jgi:hypothetical protein
MRTVIFKNSYSSQGSGTRAHGFPPSFRVSFRRTCATTVHVQCTIRRANLRRLNARDDERSKRYLPVILPVVTTAHPNSQWSSCASLGCLHKPYFFLTRPHTHTLEEGRSLCVQSSHSPRSSSITVIMTAATMAAPKKIIDVIRGLREEDKPAISLEYFPPRSDEGAAVRTVIRQKK